MATGTLSPSPFFQFFSDAGAPLAGGFLYTFVTGTDTPATTYQNRALTVEHSNPIELDAAGRCTVYLDDAVVYKYVLKTSAGVTVKTTDGIEAVPGSIITVGQVFSFDGQSSYPVTNSSYNAGALFTALHPGTGIWHVDPDDLPGSYKIAGVGVVDAGKITIALVNLSDGDPDTPIAIVELNSTTGEWDQSTADIVLPAGGSAKDFAIKTKITAPATSGYAWGIAVVRTD